LLGIVRHSDLADIVLFFAVSGCLPTVLLRPALPRLTVVPLPVRVVVLFCYRYACDVWQTDGVSGSMHQDHCRNHYFRSHSEINRHAVVPIGPIVDFNAAHGREEQFAGIAP